jgi:lipopolysaccharide/colanic/teichoic acid biosynthesis glycosyltransferase
VERIRADRTDVGFALLLWIEAPGKSDDPDWFETVRNRLRATDILGRWDARRIAILLPDTDEAGAGKLSDELQGLLLANGIRGAFEAYTHAPLKDTKDNGDPPPSNGDDSQHAINGNGHIEFAGQAKDQAAEPDHAAFVARMAAAPLESLLVRKLPLWKRLLDVAGAGAGLVALAPLFVIIALAVKLTSRGPTLFAQWRSGLGGRPFKMFKFRTMAVDAEARQAELRPASEQDGPAFKLKRDPRVTLIGRLLRKTSIDELPQLWNVLKGEMTLVGPRPLPCDETEACRPWQRRRLAVTPGLTCFWQVEGRSQVSFDDWMRADLRYVRRRSLWTDLRLILRTVPAVLFGRGAH